MKRLAIALVFTLPLLASLPAAAAEKTSQTSYSGHWTLSKEKSEGLPLYYAQIQSHELDIEQSTESLRVKVAIQRADGATDRFDLPYTLDGKDTKSEAATIRTPKGPVAVPTTLNARLNAAGNAHIVITREVPMGDSTFKGVTTEDWSLSEDGKTLIIEKSDTMPRGEVKSRMVFQRQG